MPTHLTYNELMNVLPLPPREPRPVDPRIWWELERAAREDRKPVTLARVSIQGDAR